MDDKEMIYGNTREKGRVMGNLGDKRRRINFVFFLPFLCGSE